jgi:hypothetical protein
MGNHKNPLTPEFSVEPARGANEKPRCHRNVTAASPVRETTRKQRAVFHHPGHVKDQSGDRFASGISQEPV